MGDYVNGEDLLAFFTISDVSFQCKECFTQNFCFLLIVVTVVSNIIFSISPLPPSLPLFFFFLIWYGLFLSFVWEDLSSSFLDTLNPLISEYQST